MQYRTRFNIISSKTSSSDNKKILLFYNIIVFFIDLVPAAEHYTKRIDCLNFDKLDEAKVKEKQFCWGHQI